MIATEKEWVYLLDPIKHLLEKDVDAMRRRLEQQEDAGLHHLDVGHPAHAEDHPVLDVDQEAQ